MASYRHSDDMGQISGFGGGYEAACQDMLNAGVNWLVANAEKRDFKTSEYKGVFGIIQPASDDAKKLSEVVGSACKDCTGAMHHAVMNRLLFIASKGWDAHCQELRSHNAGSK